MRRKRTLKETTGGFHGKPARGFMRKTSEMPFPKVHVHV
jgi:hypothetical protein